MATAVRIDPATVHDVPLLLRLIRELAEYERMSGEVVATEARLRETLFGVARHAEAVVARVDDNPVGFALWFHSYSTFLAQPGLYLEDLFVLPDWRGRGVGGALLRYLARTAHDRGCGRLEWAVLNWNDTAIGFYEKIGARRMDGWTTYRLAGEALRRVAR
jgi:GNAT superfamily N-acetyltransferase